MSPPEENKVHYNGNEEKKIRNRRLCKGLKLLKAEPGLKSLKSKFAGTRFKTVKKILDNIYFGPEFSAFARPGLYMGSIGYYNRYSPHLTAPTVIFTIFFSFFEAVISKFILPVAYNLKFYY